MARPKRVVIEEIEEVDESQDTILNILSRLFELEIRVLDLENICIKPVGKSINKIEKTYGEEAPTIESYNGMKMDDSDKIQSMRNAIKILPPNMIVDGRHLKENVEAIVGFKVLDEMMDAAYEGIKYESSGN